jgi:chemotaxis protein MotB
MASKDWQRMDSIDEIATISGNRGRGWRIFSVILLVGTGAFVAAYYLPLYRAHTTLVDKFQSLSREANTQHKQLTETLDTLKQVAAERDHLAESSRKEQEAGSARASQVDSIERELRTQLKKFIGPAKLGMEQQKGKLVFTLASPALVAKTGGALAEAGKSVICVIGAAAKAANLGIQIHTAVASSVDIKATDWQVSALRAGNAAQQLVGKCGVESNRVKLQVSTASPKVDASALVMEIAPGA